MTGLISSIVLNSDLNIKSSGPKYLKLVSFFETELVQKDLVLVAYKRKLDSNILSDPSVLSALVSDSTRSVFLDDCFGGKTEAKFVPVYGYKQYVSNYKEILNQIFDAGVQTIDQNKFNFIFIDIPTVDILANRGSFSQVVESIKILDGQLQKLAETVIKVDGTLIFTSPYGNFEKMVNRDEYESLNSCTLDPTPFLLISNLHKRGNSGKPVNFEPIYDMISKKDSLFQVAPTILELLRIPISEQLIGKSLLKIN
jgi:hypothetical protein